MYLMDRIMALLKFREGKEDAVEPFKLRWKDFVTYWKRMIPSGAVRKQILDLL